jgi:hypothetical protein
MELFLHEVEIGAGPKRLSPSTRQPFDTASARSELRRAVSPGPSSNAEKALVRGNVGEIPHSSTFNSPGATERSALSGMSSRAILGSAARTSTVEAALAE